jgi:hypothetical protein
MAPPAPAFDNDSSDDEEADADHDGSFDVAILMHQNFDGSFDPNASLCAFLGTTAAALESAAASSALIHASLPACDRLRFWTTVNMIAQLTNKYAAFESSWSLVVEKAKGWCMAALQRAAHLDRPAARQELQTLLSALSP